MMGRSPFEATSKRVEQYLSGIERAQTAMEIAEFLEVSNSTAYGILELMTAFGTVQKIKRGGRQYYLPKGVYNEEQISAMLPTKKVKPKPRRRSILRSPRRSQYPVRESFLNEHLSTMRDRANSAEGPSALTIIGLTQLETAEENILEEESLREPDIEIEVKEEKKETPVKIEPFATIEHLPKDVTKLTLGQTNHIKEQLKGLHVYDKIERLKTVFTKVSAIDQGTYDKIFYFSMGTNPGKESTRSHLTIHYQ